MGGGGNRKGKWLNSKLYFPHIAPLFQIWDKFGIGDLNVILLKTFESKGKGKVKVKVKTKM